MKTELILKYMKPSQFYGAVLLCSNSLNSDCPELKLGQHLVDGRIVNVNTVCSVVISNNYVVLCNNYVVISNNYVVMYNTCRNL